MREEHWAGTGPPWLQMGPATKEAEARRSGAFQSGKEGHGSGISPGPGGGSLRGQTKAAAALGAGRAALEPQALPRPAGTGGTPQAARAAAGPGQEEGRGLRRGPR